MRAPAAWRRVSHLPFQTIDEVTLVVNPARREVHLLNETASRVWELCAKPLTMDELLDTLGDEYDAPRDELLREVTELMDGLRDKSLLVRA
jgi:hypothetical protein